MEKLRKDSLDPERIREIIHDYFFSYRTPVLNEYVPERSTFIEKMYWHVSRRVPKTG